MTAVSKPLTVLCAPLATSGHVNPCVALGKLLRERGHRIVFATERSWKGKFISFGFEEELYDQEPPGEDGTPANPNELWANFISKMSPLLKRPTIEQIAVYVKNVEIFVRLVTYSNGQMRKIIEKVKPDLILQDHYLSYPAITLSGVPWVHICSANPLCLYESEKTPPARSGYSTTDTTEWAPFLQTRHKLVKELWERFNQWTMECGCPSLKELSFQFFSTNLNIYIYPKALDYTNLIELGDECHRIDSISGSKNNVSSGFEVPTQLANLPGKLIYFSMGSFGSGDVELMKQLVAILSKAPHRFIVSKGPFHYKYELSPNMWGEEFLPQLSILPVVDLVITHGGNNTVTECLTYGKPMIVIPLFWDQHDNAQRVVECKLGARCDVYSGKLNELPSLIDQIAEDQEIRANVARVSEQIKNSKSMYEAVDKIEKIAKNPKFPIFKQSL